jgi:hypothetical protein
MAEGYGAGRLVWPHRVKRKHDLAAVLHPAAMLGHAVLADVKRVENGCAIRGQVEGKDPFRRIRRRRLALISTCKISLLPPGKVDGCSRASRWKKETKNQQGNMKLGADEKPQRSVVHAE